MQSCTYIVALHFGLVLALSSSLYAQFDKLPIGLLPDSKPTADQIQHMIDQLAATKPEPPKGSDQHSPRENQVWQAVDALHGWGEYAFPQLIAHFEDNRFCCSEDGISDDNIYHLTVGDVCFRIISSQVNKYVPWKQNDTRGTPGYGTGIVPVLKKDAEAWWSINSTKALWELQTDNIRSVIKLNQERLEVEVDQKIKQRGTVAIEANIKLIESLKKNMKAMQTVPFRPYRSR